MKYLYFTSPNCGPCKIYGPIMEQISQQGIPVQKIDVNKNKILTSKYNIKVVPTTILVNDQNSEIFKRPGIIDKDFLIEIYKNKQNGKI